MKKLFLWLLVTAAGLTFWTALVIHATAEGWFRDAVAPTGNAQEFMEAMKGSIEEKSRGNIAFVLIENGQVFDEHSSSVGDPIDSDTLFQAASLSKWITAWGVMTLVEEGKLDLDEPVSTYLSRWQLPESPFDNGGVTLRRLLSHTSGLTDGLGYAGFAPGTPVQTLEASLDQPHSSSPEEDHTIVVGIEPGGQFKYSGGGYSILQLLIEEVTGEAFEGYIQREIFDPLGMERTTYEIDPARHGNVAESLQIDGKPSIRQRWTNTGAASIYTNASDMVRFLLTNLPGPSGEPIGRGVLSPATVEQMQEPHASVMGMDIWGLGPILLAPNGSGGFVIGGAGIRAKPAINADIRINPATGNGVVALQTGNRALATDLASEWTFWETGKRDLMMMRAAGDSMKNNILGGWLTIIVISLTLGWRSRRAARSVR